MIYILDGKIEAHLKKKKPTQKIIFLYMRSTF